MLLDILAAPPRVFPFQLFLLRAPARPGNRDATRGSLRQQVVEKFLIFS
jgi:hypothetical protein